MTLLPNVIIKTVVFNSTVNPIPVKQFSSGIYVVKIACGNKVYSSRLIKQ